MTSVTVITGGAGGMGLATAKSLGAVGSDRTVVLADVRHDRLDRAAATLADLGVSAVAVECDVTDPVSVTRLMETALAHGTLASVIHTAGVSPAMGDAEYVMRTNTIGTLLVNEAFYRVAGEGAAIVNVASMASYLMPESLVPAAHFPLALQDQDRFLAEMASSYGDAPQSVHSGLAYGVSKTFVRWYSASQAERFNGRGLRIVSVSPGSIDTEMGRLEADGGAGAIVADAAVPRWGTAEEMADLFVFCVSDKAGYLTGTDILCDGGVVASTNERNRKAAESA